MVLYYYGIRDTSATYALNFLNLIPICTFLTAILCRYLTSITYISKLTCHINKFLGYYFFYKKFGFPLQNGESEHSHMEW